MMHICFLGYDRDQTKIIPALEKMGHQVCWSGNAVGDFLQYDLVISLGYRHIIPQEVLDTLKRPALNLHIAYLPYNRGAHPNFWSWIEETPSGVTIHEIDGGIDTGPIIFRRGLINCGETLATSYAQLIREVEELFIDHTDALLAGDYTATPQEKHGSYHNSSDLPDWVDWDMPIEEAKTRWAETSPKGDSDG